MEEKKLDIANRDSKSPDSEISSRILTLRGVQVLLDYNLAELYGVETKRINEQVKRNRDRFPADFVFQLSNKEADDLKSQIATSSWGGIRKLPYAFTENGIAMLSGVLRSPIAIGVNIRIMRAFTAMRRFLANNAQMIQRMETIEYHQLTMKQHQEKTDKRIDEVFRRIDQYNLPPQGIFYDGQVFDAYDFISKLIKEARQRIILIDNYVDESVLTMLDKRKIGVNVTIFTHTISRQLQLDIDKYNAQNTNRRIIVREFRKSHDRFLCIDDKVYHIGASLKDLGKKWFAFSLMRDLTPAIIVGNMDLPASF
jgi:hypothetical protein